MPDKDKGFKQKSVSVYVGRKDRYISRAIVVLAAKEGISESEFLKYLFRAHCQDIGILRLPEEEGQKERWNRKAIEALEAKYLKHKKRKFLSKEVIAVDAADTDYEDDNDEDDDKPPK